MLRRKWYNLFSVDICRKRAFIDGFRVAILEMAHPMLEKLSLVMLRIIRSESSSGLDSETIFGKLKHKGLLGPKSITSVRRQLKNLIDGGYVSIHKVSVRGRVNKFVYEITEKGLRINSVVDKLDIILELESFLQDLEKVLSKESENTSEFKELKRLFFCQNSAEGRSNETVSENIHVFTFLDMIKGQLENRLLRSGEIEGTEIELGRLKLAKFVPFPINQKTLSQAIGRVN